MLIFLQDLFNAVELSKILIAGLGKVKGKSHVEKAGKEVKKA